LWLWFCVWIVWALWRVLEGHEDWRGGEFLRVLGWKN